MSCYACKHQKTHFESNFKGRDPVFEGLDLKESKNTRERVCLTCGTIWKIKETHSKTTEDDVSHLPPSERYAGEWTEARGEVTPVSLAYLIQINRHIDCKKINPEAAQNLVEQIGKQVPEKLIFEFMEGKLKPSGTYPSWTPIEIELTHWLEKTYADSFHDGDISKTPWNSKKKKNPAENIWCQKCKNGLSRYENDFAERYPVLYGGIQLDFEELTSATSDEYFVACAGCGAIWIIHDEIVTVTEQQVAGLPPWERYWGTFTKVKAEVIALVNLNTWNHPSAKDIARIDKEAKHNIPKIFYDALSKRVTPK